MEIPGTLLSKSGSIKVLIDKISVLQESKGSMLDQQKYEDAATARSEQMLLKYKLFDLLATGYEIEFINESEIRFVLKEN